MSVILLTLPGTDFPEEGWFDKIWLDKWIHIGMFSVMVALWCKSLQLLKPNSSSQKLKQLFIVTAIIFLGYGIAMEFVQKYFIPFRSFDVLDMLADGIGCTVGVIFSIRRFIKR